MNGPTSQSRYVVLEHTGFGEAHVDLMIEPSPGAHELLTWRTPVWPLEHQTALVSLGEHRRAYLDYEGTIAGGRGQVRRVAQGTCRTYVGSSGLRVVQFDGEPSAWLLGETAERVATYDQGHP